MTTVIRRSFVFVIAWAALSAGGARGQLTDAQVNTLIDQLNSPSFGTREEASGALRDQLDLNLLTPDQLGLIRNEATGVNARYAGNLEVQTRAGRLLAQWANNFTPAGAVLQEFQVMVTKVDPILAGQYFRFDSFNGGANLNDPTLNRLTMLAESSRNALLGGDTANAKTNLTNLRDYVQNLGAQAFSDLGLYKDAARTMPATQADVVNRLNQAVNDVQKAIDAIGKGTNNGAPTSRQRTLVQNTGPIGNSQSIQLTLVPGQSAVAAAGLIDFFTPPPGTELAAPPAGHLFLGSVYDVLADNTLTVSGLVDVKMEYGPTLLDNPLISPSALDSLELVRITDAGIVPLTLISNDTTDGVIEGYYYAPTSGLDQFGEFAILQTVPEPSPLLLLAIGVGLLALARRGPTVPGRDRSTAG